MSLIGLPRLSAVSMALICLLAVPATAREASEINVFAWEVKPPNAKADTTPDILVGTMHVAVGPGKRLPDAVTKRLANAHQFAMEVDLSKIPPDLVARYVLLPPDAQNLQQQLPTASWNKLVTLASAHGLPASQINRMAPWFVSMTFLDLNSPGDQLMDARLRAQADSGHVPVAFFETAEEQFQALSAVTPKENIEQLQEVIDDPNRPKRELAELETAYRTGNLPDVERQMFGADRIKAYPDFYRKVFWDRNARWEPKIEAMFKPGGAVVAVGLGHMLGERGLVSMLKQHGYKVAPLTL
jgi:uncharacterized protein YbaP (TraB family)